MALIIKGPSGPAFKENEMGSMNNVARRIKEMRASPSAKRVSESIKYLDECGYDADAVSSMGDKYLVAFAAELKQQRTFAAMGI